MVDTENDDDLNSAGIPTGDKTNDEDLCPVCGMGHVYDTGYGYEQCNHCYIAYGEGID